VEFSTIFSQAVRQRFRSIHEIGIFLSSGLDSNAVNYFLHKEALHYSKNSYSYTASIDFKDFFTSDNLRKVDETLLVKELYSEHGNIFMRFPAFPKSRFSDFLLSNQTNNIFNPIIAPNSIWISGILADASADNIKRLYTGGLGNFTISWNSPNLIFQLIFQFKLIPLFHYFRDAFKYFGLNKTMRYIKRLLLRLFFEINFFSTLHLDYNDC
jgi:hypothetical protein